MGELIELIRTAVRGQYDVVLYGTKTGGYRVVYGEDAEMYQDHKAALNHYNQCCLHAETCAGFHD